MTSSASARAVALPRPARRGPPAPTVSRTVRSGNSSAPWNERPSPSRARRAGDRCRCTSWPRISIAPRARHEAADRVHERRLAGAVRADEPDDLAAADVEVDAGRRRPGRPKRHGEAARPGSTRVEAVGQRRDRRRSTAAGSGARPRRVRCLGRARRRGDPGEHRVADAVEDLHEPAGEVEEQDQQPGAAREQPDLDAVVEQRRAARRPRTRRARRPATDDEPADRRRSRSPAATRRRGSRAGCERRRAARRAGRRRARRSSRRCRTR